MTIRFAAARKVANSAVDRTLRVTLPARPANDDHVGPDRDKILKAALRHFAAHGLAAAERARENAERAFFTGDRSAYRWWLSICRTLDRRMADAVSAHMHAANDSVGRTPRR
jgi:hypothetical protein